jgi:long-subunit acyl-CoA synthetase (AMP-forming)
MANERRVVSATNLDYYCTKPDNIVDLFENSLERFASRNLFGVKNAEDFSVDNGVLTNTRKLVRRNVTKKYSEKLNALYNE